MPKDSGRSEVHIEYHKDGSVQAKGHSLAGKLSGYWEWFRKDGSLMRSGYFEDGEQTGKWTTYDKQGNVVKETVISKKKMVKARTKVSIKGK